MRKELATEAMSDDRHVELDRFAKNRRNRRNPWKRVVHAHRSAHEPDPCERTGIGGNGGTAVDPQEVPTKTARIEPFGEVRRAFGGRKTEDGNRSHRHWARATLWKRAWSERLQSFILPVL